MNKDTRDGTFFIITIILIVILLPYGCAIQQHNLEKFTDYLEGEE